MEDIILKYFPVVNIIMKIFNKDLNEYDDPEEPAELNEEGYVRIFKVPSLDHLSKRRMKKEIKKYIMSISDEIQSIEDENIINKIEAIEDEESTEDENCKIVLRYEGEDKDRFYETFKDVQSKMNRHKSSRYAYEVIKSGIATAIPIVGEYRSYQILKDLTDDSDAGRRDNRGYALMFGLAASLRAASLFMIPHIGLILSTSLGYGPGTILSGLANYSYSLCNIEDIERYEFKIDKYFPEKHASSAASS